MMNVREFCTLLQQLSATTDQRTRSGAHPTHRLWLDWRRNSRRHTGRARGAFGESRSDFNPRSAAATLSTACSCALVGGSRSRHECDEVWSALGCDRAGCGLLGSRRYGWNIQIHMGRKPRSYREAARTSRLWLTTSRGNHRRGISRRGAYRICVGGSAVSTDDSNEQPCWTQPAVGEAASSEHVGVVEPQASDA